MTLFERFSHFTLLDAAAVLFLFFCWLGIGWRIEHSSAREPSTSLLIAGYRREWMQQMITRQPRIFDAQILSTLRQGTAFFASTCVIAIGGALALIGNTEQLAGVAADIQRAAHPRTVWEIKLMVLALFLVNGFLKFVWANRLFGYCAVLMAAVPNDPAHKDALPRADQAAEINITAARHFNRGLRALYFALAAAAWLAGPIALGMAALITVVVIWRREFASHSRKVLQKS
ncbi:MAG: DUF599 domain-containing protein [Pseudomonadota bacterium]